MDPIISDADFHAIEKIARQDTNDSDLLFKIKQRATVVPDTELPDKTIRLNSFVLLWDSFLKRVVKIRIVLPDQEDVKRRNLSVFAPMGVAIFGLSESDHVQFKLPGLEKELRIIKVINK